MFYVRIVTMGSIKLRKCPPGMVCMEHTLLIIGGIVVVLSLVVMYQRLSPASSSSSPASSSSTSAPQQRHPPQENVDIHVNVDTPSGISRFFPSYPYTNLSFGGVKRPDIISNPYAPPLRDERYLISGPPGMPINMQTNIGAVDAAFRQVGILTPQNAPSKDAIVQLMGRPLFTNRSKWQYYTISNQFNGVKLPVSVKGRAALTDMGVDQLYSGDSVFVDGTASAYKVTMYENDTIRYLPFV